MTSTIKQNPMQLRDCEKNILTLQAGVVTQYCIYPMHKVSTMHNVGVIVEIDHKRPHVVIETASEVPHFDGKGILTHTDHFLHYYHFNRTDEGLWVADSRAKHSGFPLYIRMYKN